MAGSYILHDQVYNANMHLLERLYNRRNCAKYH